MNDYINREGITLENVFGNDEYSKGKLTAEIGDVFHPHRSHKNSIT